MIGLQRLGLKCYLRQEYYLHKIELIMVHVTNDQNKNVKMYIILSNQNVKMYIFLLNQNVKMYII